MSTTSAKMGRRVLALVFLWVSVACEDGPEPVFAPFSGDLNVHNGFEPTGPFTPPGETGWESNAGRGDSVDRARFCDQAETDALIQTMVVEPIKPDDSLGGVPLWNGTTPTIADDLLGAKQDGKLCEPNMVARWDSYSLVFVWGPNQEIYVVFNEQTRLVETVYATMAYLGSLSGTYKTATQPDSNPIPVVIQPRDRVKVNNEELDAYASSADQSSKSKSWLNHGNVTAMYAMIRQTFFNADPLPDDANCVSARICDIIYSGEDESVEQPTTLVIRDSGVAVGFQPDGSVSYVAVSPVRDAPFEVDAEISFLDGSAFKPRLKSITRPDCEFTLLADTPMTWAVFKNKCLDVIDDESEQYLARYNYTVNSRRDAVTVDFTGLSVGFRRTDPDAPSILRDGDRPADGDRPYALQFSRSLNAPVQEYVPRDLAEVYQNKLEEQVQEAVLRNKKSHPFSSYALTVPSFSAGSEPIGALLHNGSNWIKTVTQDIRSAYETLSDTEQNDLDPDILQKGFSVEPFTDACLAALTDKRSDTDSSKVVKAFRTTDNMKWSIGFVSFINDDDQPYRLNAQYSMYYDALTSIGVSFGYNDMDDIINAQKDYLAALEGKTFPYFTAELLTMSPQVNSLTIGSTAVKVHPDSFDRQLDMLKVTLAVPNGGVSPEGEPTADEYELTVPGAPIEDRGGYLRQLRGERFEFVPANEVRIYGNETALVLYVEEDGTIGKVVLSGFKGTVELCEGLEVSYGDDVRKRTSAWADDPDRTLSDYQSCDLVYNYSENGNVLNSVASLANRISITVAGGRAVSVSMWL